MWNGRWSLEVPSVDRREFWGIGRASVYRALGSQGFYSTPFVFLTDTLMG